MLTWFRYLRSLLIESTHDPIRPRSSHIFNDPEAYALRLHRAAEARGVEEAWKRSRRVKAEVIAFHGRRK